MVCRKCKRSIPDESAYCNLCGAAQANKKRSRKRANGTGSAYKLPGKRSKPWVAIRAGVQDDDGNIARLLIGTYATKGEAEQAIVQDTILPVSDYAGITLKDLYEMWQGTHAYLDISTATQANYNAAIKYLARFHSTRFADLRTAHFQSAVDEAERNGKSRSTLEKIKAIATILSKYAYSQDIVNKTYSQGIRLPKQQRKDIQTFTDMEIETLFKHADDGVADTILILIYTGMRIQELLTLTKFNVDIKEMLITGGVKTEAGRDRVIPIHPKIQALVRHRYDNSKNHLIEYEKMVGNKKKGSAKHIVSKYAYEYYCDLYYETLERYGIRRLTPHKARHTFFTRLSERCADRKGMALVGGHADPNFTEKTYVQPDIERLRKVIDCL